MKVRAGSPEVNYLRAERLISKAAMRSPDVILLPELWNTGFAPGKIDPTQADNDGVCTKALCGKLAKEFGVNIVAGSVLCRRNGALYNTAYVFDRSGDCIAEYDKTHLFSPLGEDRVYSAGDRVVTFPLDGVTCGIMICYDLRFGELARVMALSGAKVLFIAAAWPIQRINQVRMLLKARAIENQVFAAFCNGCGKAAGMQYGGNSAIADLLGNILAKAGRRERIITVDLDFEDLERIRRELPVFLDRRPELYGAISQTADRQ